jgi:hypothetical protein
MSSELLDGGHPAVHTWAVLAIFVCPALGGFLFG